MAYDWRPRVSIFLGDKIARLVFLKDQNALIHLALFVLLEHLENTIQVFLCQFPIAVRVVIDTPDFINSATRVALLLFS